MTDKARSLIAATFVAASLALTLSACGGNGCDASHPYACEQQREHEKEASDNRFNGKVADIVRKRKEDGTCPARETATECEMSVLIEMSDNNGKAKE